MKRIYLSILLLLIIHISNAQLNQQWQFLGPDNLGGPVRALILDNRDPTRQTLYAGVMGGGVWKSTDGAASWHLLSGQSNYAISCIAQASNGTIYIGTGNGYNTLPAVNNVNGLSGNGIYKLDPADNFISLPSTVPTITTFNPWLIINRIAVNPVNPNDIIIATGGGLYKSTDAGGTWSAITIPPNYNINCNDVKWSSDGMKVFADMGYPYDVSILVRSLDAGNSWAAINGNTNSGYPSVGVGRIEIAISPSNSDVVYLSLATSSSSSTYGVLKSSNAGNTWDTVVTWRSGFDPLKMQGWFDNAIAVSPSDTGKIYAGGTSMYSYSQQTGVHHLTDFVFPNADSGLYIDQFVYAINDLNPEELYVATNRGVFKTTQAVSNFTDAQFNAMNNGLTARDLFTVAAAKNGWVIGASQFDDGLLTGNLCNKHFKNENNYADYCEISNLDSSYAFIEDPFGYLLESNDQLNTAISALDSNIDPTNSGFLSRCNSNAPSFLGPMLLSETTQAFDTYDSVLYTATTAVSAGSVVSVKSTTAGKFFQYILPIALQPGEQTMVPDPVKSRLFLITDCGVWVKQHALEHLTQADWFQISIKENASAIGLTKSGNRAYVGFNSGQVQIINGLNLSRYIHYNMTDSFNVTVDSFMPMQRTIQSISVDMNDDNHLLIAVEHFIGDSTPNAYQSTNGGVSWTPLQVGPAGTTVFSCLIDASNGANYIAGTDKGIWASNNAGVTWLHDSSAIYNVPVIQIRQIPLNEDSCYALYAATTSRGLWRSVALTPGGCNTTIATGPCDSVLEIRPYPITSNDFSIYPNPANSYTTVRLALTEPQQVTIQISDITGRQIQSLKQFLSSGFGNVDLNTSQLHSGTYLVTVAIAQIAKTKLLVIEK